MTNNSKIPDMPKRHVTNRLNELDAKTWLKFQKSWFVHSPPPRKKDVVRHPAKFPETLAQEFIEFFTKPGQTVFDPMLGTGTTCVAALRCGRHSAGIELNPAYAAMAEKSVAAERERQAGATDGLQAAVLRGDASELVRLLMDYPQPFIHYVLTSPPYWDMLRARGAKTQKERREATEKDVFYSDDPNDLGNIGDYEIFLERLIAIYISLKAYLFPKAYLTIVVKNVKKGGKVYPLAWDLGRELGKAYTLKDERIWCQDDIRLAPYGFGNAWVSNTVHHYCLQFRYEVIGES